MDFVVIVPSSLLIMGQDKLPVIPEWILLLSLFNRYM